VRFSFAGSSDLVAQIQQGAPADVFASADTSTMDIAVTGNLLDGRPRSFARNTLEIATPPGNPAGVTSLADLADPDMKVVLCAPVVPCGAAAAGVQKASGVDISPVSEEQSVTDVLGKVSSGEADAGLVYVTDVAAAGDAVHGVPFAESSEVVNTYPIATVKGSKHPDTAQRFADFVTGAEGQAVLAAAGFARP
jgi:molybdate transport system substrate-binding protein